MSTQGGFGEPSPIEEMADLHHEIERLTAERDAAKHESYLDRCRGDNLQEEVVRLRKIEAAARKNRNEGLRIACRNGCLSPGSTYVCTLCALDAALAESTGPEPDRVYWFAETEEPPPRYAVKGTPGEPAHLTDDPLKATRFEDKIACLAFVRGTYAKFMDWKLKPVEHMFMGERKKR